MKSSNCLVEDENDWLNIDPYLLNLVLGFQAEVTVFYCKVGNAVGDGE